MSKESKQWLRIVKFLAELKRNNYPNATSFAKLLQRHKADIDLSCSSKTVQRDIQALKEVYGAPIRYDSINYGYHLTDSDWELDGIRLDENILNNLLLGADFTTAIFPKPLKDDITNAVEKGYAICNDFFDGAMMDSLLCLSSIKVELNPTIFKHIFNAWRYHQAVEFIYNKPNCEPQLRRFEPHIVAFHQGVWYTKGYEYQTKQIKSYAIHRIKSFGKNIDTFESDKKLIQETKEHGLFEYYKVENAKLHCDKSIAFYLHEQQKKRKYQIEKQSDGSLIVTMPAMIEHELIRFILGEAGLVTVLEPTELRQKISQLAKEIHEKNC